MSVDDVPALLSQVFHKFPEKSECILPFTKLSNDNVCIKRFSYSIVYF
jgi:hypothetical protein